MAEISISNTFSTFFQLTFSVLVHNTISLLFRHSSLLNFTTVFSSEIVDLPQIQNALLPLTVVKFAHFFPSSFFKFYYRQTIARKACIMPCITLQNTMTPVIKIDIDEDDYITMPV